ncbi:MAG: D-aminoacyl-tRNA deacylase [Candidatus Bathyarchaeia archaeon]
MILIAASKLDRAALNIAKNLLEISRLKNIDQTFSGEPVYSGGNLTLIYVDVDSVDAKDLDKHFKPEGIVFASRHSSETKEPTLTVHVPGNLLSDARFGGNPSEVAIAWPERMSRALTTLDVLKSELNTEYKVSLEATHHGPTAMSVPVWFVEIGSSEKQWNDHEAGNVVAQAILKSTEETSAKPYVGFGGGHYAPKHTKMCLEEGMAVGHIVPKHAVNEVQADAFRQLFDKTRGNCSSALLDWKGLSGPQRAKIMTMLDDCGISDIIKA